MAQTTFAVVAPSVTLNEIMFLDVPFVAIQTADNQREMVKYLNENSLPLIENFSHKILRGKIQEILKEVI
jgi:UDP-2,4-diacetamido-2,4,6-trideoxy-beta-L-altropyranose hydrolase/pseudaminic acid synthase